MDSLLADRGGVCLCGAVGAWTLTFGGGGPARFTCNVCDRDYDVDGNPLTKPG